MLKLTITVEVRFIGFLREMAEDEEVSLEFDNPVAVRDVLSKLGDALSINFQHGYTDLSIIEAHADLLILLNGKDINILRVQTT